MCSAAFCGKETFRPIESRERGEGEEWQRTQKRRNGDTCSENRPFRTIQLLASVTRNYRGTHNQMRRATEAQLRLGNARHCALHSNLSQATPKIELATRQKIDSIPVEHIVGRQKMCNFFHPLVVASKQREQKNCFCLRIWHVRNFDTGMPYAHHIYWPVSRRNAFKACLRKVTGYRL